ncbi:MAG TPA: type I polyketide synthase [Stellaceae bacterium]|nr:type I polyketide synthase [Stellaceae bacterium]
MVFDPTSRRAPFPVAIVGVACRFPGADSLEEYWSLLKSGTDAVGTVPPDRWDVDFYYNPDQTRPGKIYTRAGGFLRQVDRFDAEFFGISPREAAQIDPQQRLALELAWEALESAGIVPASIAGSEASVVMGVSSNDYAALQREQGEGSDPYTMSGNAFSLLANRISYVLDLHGPSLALDTACSSGLVAIHEACETLRRGDSPLAIAGGINLLLSPWGGIGFSRARMLSPSGHCHTFDARADGYVRSEGGGVVVLKPLAAALADGDAIKAVILASAVNSDGKTNGVSMPNVVAQEALLRRVYGRAEIDPGTVDYVEAHGTGTNVGDPVECTALGAVIGAARQDGRPVLVGSGKTNIGHLESAAGIAGLLKVVLSLQHREVPATLNFDTPNPKIRFDELNLAVVAKHTNLRRRGRRLVMGVNSFGFGGTNAHVVVQEYRRPAETSTPADEAQLLLISGRGEGVLKELGQRYERLLRQPGADHAAICRAAARSRSHFSHRLAVLGSTAGEIADSLQAFAAGETVATAAVGEALAAPTRLAFVFSGNGSQWFGMGRDLIAREPAIAAWIGKIDAVLAPLVGWSLMDVLARDGAPEDSYDRTEIAQPALFALQVAMVEWLRAKGIAADACLGHSVGEVAAAYAVGALSLDQACRVIAHRSAVQGKTAGMGKMMAVGLSAAQVAPLIAPYGNAVTIAAFNSPASVTLAGDEDVLRQIGEGLEKNGLFHRHLALDYAFHSRVMDGVKGELLERLSGLAPSAERVPFISTVTGGALAGSELGPQYWWENIREPVRFAEAVDGLVKNGVQAFLEIGPHPVLTYYVRDGLRQAGVIGVALATLRRQEPEVEALNLAAGACYNCGVAVNFTAMFPGKGPWAELPAYPWQREKYELPKRVRPWSPVYGASQHPLLGYRMPTSVPTWEQVIEPSLLTYLRDHVVQGSTVFPAAGYVEMALAAGTLRYGTEALVVEGLEIQKPIVIAENDPPRLEFALSADDNGFRVSGGIMADIKPALVAVGRVMPLTAKRQPDDEQPIDDVRARLSSHLGGAEHYRLCAEHGLSYGATFQGVADIWFGHGEALGRIAAPDAVASDAVRYSLHPALFDACIQVMFATFAWSDEAAQRAAYVPIAIERLRLYRKSGRIAWCHARLRERKRRSASADFVLYDDAGIVAEIEGLQLRRLDAPSVPAVPAYHWEQQLQPRASSVIPAAPITPMTGLSDAARTVLAASQPGEAIAPMLERIAVAYAAKAIERIGEGSATVTLDDLVDKDIVSRRNLPYLRALLGMLERRDILQRTATGWRHGRVAAEAPEPLWRGAIAAHPTHLASLELVARCGERIPAFLASSGEEDAQSPLLRDADLVEQLVESDPLFRRRNEVAASLVTRLLRDLPKSDPLRVLELGDGPGGLAATLLPLLPTDRTEYDYGVLSDDTAALAAAKFADRPFVRVRTLDLDRDLEIEAGTLDLLLIGNAMFGTAELKPALTRLANLVKPGGMVAMIGTGSAEMMTYLFGMSQRWWDFTDIDLRTDSPLVSSATWSSLFKETGLVEVESLGGGKRERWPSWALLARKGAAFRFAPINDQETGYWMIVSQQDHAIARDGLHAATALGEALDAQGHRLVTLDIGGEFRRLGPDRFVAPIADRHAYRTLLSDLASEAVEARLHVVCFAGAAGADGSYGVVVLLQAAEELGLLSRLDLWLVTAGAMPALGRAGAVDPGQAMIWGIARTMMTERPDLTCRLVDLDPAYDAEAAAALLLEEFPRGVDDAEDEVIWSGAGRYVNRVRRGLPSALTHAEHGFGLFNAPRDGRDELSLRAIEFGPLPSASVRVRVRASGLNFRDVLQRGGILPEEAFEGGFAGSTLGMEFAGEIVETGAAVSRFRVGDAVFGFAPSALSSQIVAEESSVFPKPASWSDEEAAGIPVAMMTALFSLEHLARMRRGERVLIHGAAGGVGLAAIQIAQAIGAEIYATAGTPEKRAFLRRLGVPFVFDSRTLDFDHEIRRITKGEGVDVVLNSIAGEAIPKGVALLRSYGRFIELGKRDFYANSKLGLEPFRRNIQFFGVDINTLIAEQRELTAAVVSRLMALIADGTLKPLAHRVFPATRATEAFRYMQQSRQIGKVVLSFADETVPVEPLLPRHLLLRPDATYLVTGGRGGFGLATAEWLVGRGAKHLALIGRRAQADRDTLAVLNRLRGQGVSIREAACDVTDASALDQLLAAIDRDMPPLRGVFHAAGVIDDALLAKMTREQFDAVTRPKVIGALNLHNLTRERALDHFVLYSSATTLIGNPGQAAYVAANLYLEALAQQRRSLGLPALAMLWGAIGQVGHLAKNAELAKIMEERLGVVPIDPQRAFDGMERALLAGVGHAAAAELDWAKLSRLPRIAKAPKYEAFSGRMNGDDSFEASLNLTQLMARVAAVSLDEATALVAPMIVKQISEVMRIPGSKLDADRSLIDVGMDSMMMVELQMMMERAFGLRLPVLDLMDRATVAGISRRLAEEIQNKAKSNGVDHSASFDIDIDTVPEEQLDEILGELLKEELDIGADRRAV